MTLGPKIQAVQENDLTWARLEEWMRDHDRTSFFALKTVKVMQQDNVLRFAQDIFSFVNRRYPQGALDQYTKRVEDLRGLQGEFEKTGSYPARRYAEIKSIDDETYKLALLLSFVCTNHRFEILKELHSFLGEPRQTHQRLLSIGYGAGYELKLARETLPEWIIEGFDSSQNSADYANDLLDFFHCRSISLSSETFPLETAADLPEKYRRAFGKIVLCELMEHLQDPVQALKNLYEALEDNGHMFVTMAINIAQEDHVFLYSSVEQAKSQLLEAGYHIVRELLAPVVVLPFREVDREKIFRKGNYICVVEKRPTRGHRGF